ncbi:alpha/beta fold hydrolase [Streptomyces sp. P9(2023)]|uniref:esterase/lipase family protein n=1 Tax=Streptomyces sp. P9(2023) TaxID=3064394 RepID=UPI0028F437AB|nr:alpha/beta fold hydrolase [Streptomyces sp. P9(2023)]MDT9693408.1 alpha/beta fold hydrolase [Streptomyces sp. P9(2023)]
MTNSHTPERQLHDAVVVVPGIMGSALRDVENDTPLWGVRRVFQYSTRMYADKLRALAVTDAERAGETGRIEATGILNVADWFPGLGKAQPYNDLVSKLRQAALHRTAVLPFAYDWRLSVAHNGALLAREVRRHLDAWRAHGLHRRFLAEHPELGPAKVIFVAHSMGGLLAREVLHHGGLKDDVRAVMTVGTPFGGSVNAALMLNAGKGGPGLLPPSVLSEITPTMPGLYDLLPSYRCREYGTDMRAPDVDDVVALGGRRDLAEASADWRASRHDTLLPEHVMVVGTGQRTWQSYRLNAGAAVGQRHMIRRDGDRPVLDENGHPRTEDRKGDGTVYRFAAHLPGSDARAIDVYQEHSALARSESVIDMACGMLSGLRHRDELGSMLGAGEFELHTPEWADPDTAFTIEVGDAPHSADLECVVREVSGLDTVLYPALKPVRGTEDAWAATCLPDRPGLYEVEVRGGVEPMRRLVPVLAPEQHG